MNWTRSVALPIALCVLLASCENGGSPVTASLTAPGARSAASLTDEGPRFSEWSAPRNVGAPVNTASAEQAPAISKDGLSMFFHCLQCPGGLGSNDIWVAERSSVDEPWGVPRNLGPAINTVGSEGAPALSTDGHSLYFNSSRPGGLGSGDLYVARRRDKRDNLGWEEPVNLGPAVNSAADEAGAEIAEGASGAPILYFASTRLGGPGAEDLYYATLQEDGTFGAATLVDGLNSPFRDSGMSLRKDGLEVFFVSDRPGGVGGVDIWTATRATSSDPWSTPTNMGAPINGLGNDAAPALSRDGTVLYFHSANRAGNVGGPFFDLWLVTRSKVTGHD